MQREQFGTTPTTKPEGMLRPIRFPLLMPLGVATGDGRFFETEGRGVRELPRPIWFQKSQALNHEGAVGVGSLREVTFEDNAKGKPVAWGRGWLLDTPEGRETALYVQTQSIYHNSVDLNDISMQFELIEDGEDLDLQLRFTQYAIGGTTIVGSPAFADAQASLDAETLAAYRDDDSELVVDVESVYNFDITTPELVASDATVVPWADFYIPEPDHRQKIIVDADRVVCGHLGIWNEPHGGQSNTGKYPPRPSDGYASFNQPGPLTEHGQVETGPIFLTGGHPKQPLGQRDPYEAYGGVENCWADVRVIPGKFGPWVSGRVRPSVDDDMLYAARASRISGHWVGDSLRAITSVNVAGFDIGGSGLLGEVVIRDGKVLEMVASFWPEDEEETVAAVTWADIDKVAEAIASKLSEGV